MTEIQFLPSNIHLVSLKATFIIHWNESHVYTCRKPCVYDSICTLPALFNIILLAEMVA